MKTAKLVEALLKRYPNTRNSDKDLIIGVLQAKGVCLSDQDREIIRSISFESVTRCRRKLQEEGKYMPTDPRVTKQRKLKGLIVQQNAPMPSSERLSGLIEEHPKAISWLED